MREKWWSEIHIERKLSLLSGLGNKCRIRWGGHCRESEGIENRVDSDGEKLGPKLAMQRRPKRTASLFRGDHQRQKNPHILQCGSAELAVQSDIRRETVLTWVKNRKGIPAAFHSKLQGKAFM